MLYPSCFGSSGWWLRFPPSCCYGSFVPGFRNVENVSGGLDCFFFAAGRSGAKWLKIIPKSNFCGVWIPDIRDSGLKSDARTFEPSPPDYCHVVHCLGPHGSFFWRFGLQGVVFRPFWADSVWKRPICRQGHFLHTFLTSGRSAG